jgi:8-oxo-dGTP diphosphatase
MWQRIVRFVRSALNLTPKAPTPSPEKPQAFACGLVIVNDEGLVLGVSRRHRPGSYGFPGGKREPDESIALCAFRELKEETGIEATNMVFLLADNEDDTGHSMVVYVVEKYKGTPRQMEDGIEVKWMPWEEMLAHTPWPLFNRKVYDAWGTMQAAWPKKRPSNGKLSQAS